MTAHTRIQAAEKAVATGHLNAVTARSDSDHEAAVELERRKLLTETREQLEREIREDIAAEIAAARTANWYEQPHDVLAVALREGMRRALRIVLGEASSNVPAPEPSLLADGVRREPAAPKSREWDRVSGTWFASGPWVLAWQPTLRDDGDRFIRWEGWYLSGPGAPEFGVAMGVGDEAPLLAADVWIATSRRPDRPRSRESVCRSRRLPDLRGIVRGRPGSWTADRVRSVLWPDAVSERDALGLLDALTAEGVLVRDPARARWAVPEVQAVIDAGRSRLNCRRCGFDFPARYIGDDVLCWGCKAAVSDGPSPDGSPGDLFDPCDPAGDAE